MTLVIAHRGASVSRPENTIAAFLEARRQGADMVELDVRRTADGALAVHHDPVLPGSGAVATLRRDQLYDEVPLLEEAIDACLPMAVNVEVKNVPFEPDWDDTRTVATRVAELVVARGLHAEILLSSFDLGSIDRVREIDPTIETALLSLDGEARTVEVCAGRGHVALHPFHAAVTADVVARAHEAGLRVNVWTVDDPDRIRALVDLGVDGICTNVPDVALRVLGR